MGSSLATCCRTCACPQQKDTAIGRRQILNGPDGYYLKDHASYSSSSSVKITTEYVEKPNGELLYTKLFEPKDATKAKGMICYSIGFGDHTDWHYHDIGYKYAQLGFIIYMPEYKGTGRSDGRFMEIESFDAIVDDMIWIFDYAVNKYIKSNKIYKNRIDKYNNYFLSGTSMGGALTICIALKQQNKSDNRYKGLVTTAPMVALAAEVTPPQWQIFCLQSCLLPCCPYWKCVPNGVGDNLTNDKALLKEILANPVMYLENLPLCTGNEMLETTLSLTKRANELKMPMLIVHGDADTLTDPGHSKQYYEKCGCDKGDKELRIYPNRGHIIYEEEPKVFDDSVKWMMQRIKQDDDNGVNDDEEKAEEQDEEEEEDDESQPLKD